MNLHTAMAECDRERYREGRSVEVVRIGGDYRVTTMEARVFELGDPPVIYTPGCDLVPNDGSVTPEEAGVIAEYLAERRVAA